jgi:hypothetical protein
VPLTDSDAEDLIRSVRAAPLLFGPPGATAVGLGSLKDMLLRVSRMADDLPQMTELDLSPVIARREVPWPLTPGSASSPRNPPTPTCANCGNGRPLRVAVRARGVLILAGPGLVLLMADPS